MELRRQAWRQGLSNANVGFERYVDCTLENPAERCGGVCGDRCFGKTRSFHESRRLDLRSCFATSPKQPKAQSGFSNQLWARGIAQPIVAVRYYLRRTHYRRFG